MFDAGSGAVVVAEAGRALAAVEVAAMGDDEVAQAAIALFSHTPFAGAFRTSVVAQLDSRGSWAHDGARSPAEWVAHRARCSPKAVNREVRRARKLASMPATAAAYAAGRIGADHVDVLARAHLPRTAECFARDEARLVGFAENLSFIEFRHAVRHWMHHADPDGAEDQAERQRDQRRLQISETFGGAHAIDGWGDAISGAEIAAAVDEVAQQLFEDDWRHARHRLGPHATITPDDLGRTHAQRRYDALHHLATRPANDAERRRPLITCLVDYPTLAGPVCQLANGTPITPGQVASLLSEADIERIVFDSPSRVLDVGVRRRFFTGATRRAIEVRDPTCRWPGCHIPSTRSEIDHLVAHSERGPTTQDNGAPFCRHHHRLKQDGGFQIHRHPDGTIRITRPDGRQIE